MPFGAAGLSTSRTAVSRFKAVLSEEVNCAGASGAATAARRPALLAPASTNYPASGPIYSVINFRGTLMQLIFLAHKK